jgi:hypothetical protein
MAGAGDETQGGAQTKKPPLQARVSIVSFAFSSLFNVAASSA